jgi:hypothetical protein
MKLGTKYSASCVMALGIIFTTSACARPEPPRTVSDFCLVTKRISAEPAPVAGMNDPGNVFDSEQTVAEIFEHNEVFDRLCVIRTR